MAYLKHWDRWIILSVVKWFKDHQPAGETFFFEGEERKTSQEPTWYEIRIDGPRSVEVSSGVFEHLIEVNVVCFAAVTRDFSRITTMMGEVKVIFETNIPVFRYGPNPVDDQTLVGCLTRKSSVDSDLMGNQYGQIEPKTKLIEATVEARYTILLP